MARSAERGGEELTAATARVLAAWQARSRYVPGFGHRFHPIDPRRGPLLSLVADAVLDGVVDGDYLRAALAVEEALNQGRRRPVPMNIDGATAVIYAELGFEPPLACAPASPHPTATPPIPQPAGRSCRKPAQ